MNGLLGGKTLFISGGSRGIGLAIALRAARDGANVALIAKTAEPNPRLPGTSTRPPRRSRPPAATRLPIVGDVRDEDGGRGRGRRGGRALRRHRRVRQQRQRDQPVGHRGAGDEALRPHAGHQHARHVRRHPRLHPAPASGRRTRTSSRCRRRSASSRAGSGPHVAYTIAKYGMSLCALGFAAEFRDAGIASNALWPRTLIATAAVQNLLGGEDAMAASRKPELVRGRRLRGHHPAQPRVHRQHVPVRGRARRGGRHRLRRLRVRPGSDTAGGHVRRPHLTMNDHILTEFPDGIPTPQSSVKVLPSRVDRVRRQRMRMRPRRHADAGVGDDVTALIPA